MEGYTPTIITGEQQQAQIRPSPPLQFPAGGVHGDDLPLRVATAPARHQQVLGCGHHRAVGQRIARPDGGESGGDVRGDRIHVGTEDEGGTSCSGPVQQQVLRPVSHLMQMDGARRRRRVFRSGGEPPGQERGHPPFGPRGGIDREDLPE